MACQKIACKELSYLGLLCVLLTTQIGYFHPKVESLYAAIVYAAQCGDVLFIAFILIPPLSPLISAWMFFRIRDGNTRGATLSICLVTGVPLLCASCILPLYLIHKQYAVFIIAEHIFLVPYLLLLYLFLHRVPKAWKPFYCGVLMLVFHFAFSLPFTIGKFPYFFPVELLLFLACLILILRVRRKLKEILSLSHQCD